MTGQPFKFKHSLCGGILGADIEFRNSTGYWCDFSIPISRSLLRQTKSLPGNYSKLQLSDVVAVALELYTSSTYTPRPSINNNLEGRGTHAVVLRGVTHCANSQPRICRRLYYMYVYPQPLYKLLTESFDDGRAAEQHDRVSEC